MIIITNTPSMIYVEIMQTGIKHHIASYNKSDHSAHTDLDTKRFYIIEHTNGKRIVFECFLPIVMSVGFRNENIEKVKEKENDQR